MIKVKTLPFLLVLQVFQNQKIELSYDALKEGDKAPDFKGIDQNENTVPYPISKARSLVLYFYPKDDNFRNVSRSL